MKLYYDEVLSPRKVCAVARHLDSPVAFVRIDLSRGEQRTPQFLAVNPNGKVPVLQDGDWSLWEANAIMCHLAVLAKSDLWPQDVARQIEVMRWFSWDAQHFTRHAGNLYFEYIIKSAFGIGAPDPVAVKQATESFKIFARVLDDHLDGRRFLVGDTLSVADFAIGVALPYAETAQLPLDDFPHIRQWHARLNDLPAWREPFPRLA